jgi:uncharacterized membrane protein YdjX (TVP38/TMEM64 family)
VGSINKPICHCSQNEKKNLFANSRLARCRKWVAGLLVLTLLVWLLLECDLLYPIYEWFWSDFKFWLKNHPALAPAAYVLVYILSVIVLIPGSMLTLVGGGVFGLLWSLIYVSLASTVAAGLGFLIARYMAADWVERKTSGKLIKLKRGVELEGWRFLAFSRLVPILPYSLLNYMFGLTRIKFWVYIFVSWICMLPCTFAYVYEGYAGKQMIFGEGGWEDCLTFLGTAVGLILLASMVPKMIRKIREKSM